MLRLLADENLHGDVVRGLRRKLPGVDLLTAREAGLLGADDPAVLQWAAANDRIVITQDRNTMPGFAIARRRAGQSFAGMFVLGDELTLGQAIEELAIACDANDDCWKNAL